MEGERPFTSQLAEAISQRRQQIEQSEIIRLKELYRVFHATFQGLHGVFKRKRLVQEDPYKSEQKISDIVPPDDDPYLESEKDAVLGIRLDAYDNILEFLNNYYEMRVDALGFKELKDLSDLVRYINWDQLSTASPKNTTRGIADLVHRARSGQDNLSGGIVTDAIEQLRKHAALVIEQIKVISTFKREEYKLGLRQSVFPTLVNPESLRPDDAEAMKTIRRAFKDAGMAGPFIPELVAEVWAEDFGPQGERMRDDVLARLQVERTGEKKARPKESLTEILINAIRSLAACSRSLDTVIDHLSANAEVINSRQRSFGERLRAWIDKMVNRKPQKHVYEVEMTDEATGARSRESIEFDSFVESIGRKSRLYGGFLARTGSGWAKLQKASEEQLYQFINKELGECHIIHRRALALDSYFKNKATKDERTRLRGVKIELTTLRNSIVKSNQIKHEYIAKKEELEQMKKLGMK